MTVDHRTCSPVRRRGRALTRSLVGAGVVASFSLLGVGAADAHVGPNVSEVAAGSYTDVLMGVPHGCEGSPTTKIEIQVPEALTDVTPIVVPGWTGTVTTEKLAKPITLEDGDEITERDAVVTWTAQPGNELADHWKLSFGLSFQVPDTPGKSLEFKTIQTCTEGSAEWIEPTPAGGEEPEHPAPTVMIVEGSGDGGHGGSGATTTTTEAGGNSGSATPTESKSDSSDSSKGLAVSALVVGLAGLGVGGAAFAKTRKA